MILISKSYIQVHGNESAYLSTVAGRELVEDGMADVFLLYYFIMPMFKCSHWLIGAVLQETQLQASSPGLKRAA